jgi:AAA+ ATPase superfamily predicted ATPase
VAAKPQIRNPFEYGRELSREELVDRKEELGTVAATIRNRGKLFLIGPRRYGKTSLLSAAGETAAREGVIVLRFDAEKFESLELLASALLTGATRALQGPLERTIALVGQVAAHLKPEMSVDPEGKLSIALGGARSARGELPLLTDALDAIEALAKESGREVVVILDEIQRVVVDHGIAAERQLRSTVQQHSRVGYVFAGSATRLLNEMTSKPSRPFYRLGARLFLDRIPRGEFADFLREGFRYGGIEPKDGACEHLLDRAEEVPYNVQRLAHETWEMVRADGGVSLSAAEVDAALERLVRREDPAYTQTWTTLRRNQQTTLKIVIEEAGSRLFRAEVVRRSGLSISTLQSALKGLETLELIRQESLHGKTIYRLVDPFLGAWLSVMQNAGP